MNIVALIISLVSGAVGGNVTGQAFKKLDLGVLWNSIAGIIGGGLGGQILAQFGLGGGEGGLDLASVISQIAGGGVGGGVLMAIVAAIKQATAKQ